MLPWIIGGVVGLVALALLAQDDDAPSSTVQQRTGTPTFPPDATIDPEKQEEIDKERNAPAGGGSSFVREALGAVNQARHQGVGCGMGRAVPPLTWDARLEAAAVAHARDMAARGVLSHEGSNGSGPDSRVTAAGYRWRTVSENVAEGQRSIAEAMRSWIQSPSHCANLVDADVTQVGMAFAAGRDGRLYWAQVFARPA